MRRRGGWGPQCEPDVVPALLHDGGMQRRGRKRGYCGRESRRHVRVVMDDWWLERLTSRFGGTRRLGGYFGRRETGVGSASTPASGGRRAGSTGHAPIAVDLDRGRCVRLIKIDFRGTTMASSTVGSSLPQQDDRMAHLPEDNKNPPPPTPSSVPKLLNLILTGGVTARGTSAAKCGGVPERIRGRRW